MFSFLKLFGNKNKTDSARILPAGDSTLVVEFGNRIDSRINKKVQECCRKIRESGIDGITETVPTFRSLMVCYDPEKIRYEALEKELKKQIQKMDAEEDGSASAAEAGKVVEIPVCYGGIYGEDLKDVAAINGLTEEEVIRIHCEREYPIYMLGFLPGFPYLGDMDERIHTPRLSSPRTKIPAGSVGIGGEQTGIYPLESPGGWRLIGRTPLKMYDPDRETPILYKAGDRIRFVPISEEEYAAYEQKQDTSVSSENERKGMRILQPGGQTTVQDLGRFGYMDRGFQVSGAADTYSMQAANALVGNALGAAVLEMTMLGASVFFEEDAVIALTGADMQAKLNKEQVHRYQRIQVHAGDTLEMGFAVKGCRGYLAVQGGIDVPEVLGSRSTNLKCKEGGLEGRALRAGDVVPVSPLPDSQKSSHAVPDRIEGHAPWAVWDDDGIPILRVVPGPQAEYFTEKGKKTLVSEVYMLSNDSNRMACRLIGETIEFAGSPDIISDGITLGSIQVSGSGMPMVMLADHQTTGGYAKIGTVISADIPVLAQIRPGEKVRFAYVNVKEAQKLYLEMKNFWNKTAAESV